MESVNERECWLCRHCNRLVDNANNRCPHCGAYRPEEHNEPTPEGISEVVTKSDYANTAPIEKPKYIFREAVLVNAADILLVLGLFATFGTLIAPIVTTFNVTAPMMWAVCIAIGIFALTMITWALLRTVADISRMLRNK
ncbi:MAG: hypothetical protein J6V59_05405 [Alistipes sp.]|nr:hypothetical protein [Alistipes sp.]